MVKSQEEYVCLCFNHDLLHFSLSLSMTTATTTRGSQLHLYFFYDVYTLRQNSFQLFKGEKYQTSNQEKNRGKKLCARLLQN